MPANTIKGEKVQLLNGDVFRGKFVGYDPAKGVIWRHPHISPDMNIKPDRVARVNFDGTKLPAGAKTHGCSVLLSNGDSLSGDLVKLADGKLVLKTWYAGELPINRSAIRSLSPGFTAAKMLFEGPTDVKNWTFFNPAQGIRINQLPPNAPPAVVEQMQKQLARNVGRWDLKNEGFESRTSGAMVGRNFKELPNRSSLEFDLEWTSYLNLYVNLYTDRLDSYSSCNAYSLRINQSYAYLYRYTRLRGSQRVGGNVRINLSAVPKGRASIALKVDKKKREFALYVNGKFMTKWKDIAGTDFAGKGNGLLFTSRSSNHIRLAGIRVSEWNGSLPGQNKTAAANNKDDFVVFNNEDTITGKLLGIDKGKMTFKSTLSSDGLAIPLETVDVIHLSKEGVKGASVPANSARITLKGKGSLTMQIKSWKDGKVTGVSPVFGEAMLDEGILKSVEFNLGKPRNSASVPSRPTSPYSSTTVNRNVVRGFNGGIPPEAVQQLDLQFQNKNVDPKIFERLQEKLQEQRLQVRPIPKRR